MSGKWEAGGAPCTRGRVGLMVGGEAVRNWLSIVAVFYESFELAMLAYRNAESAQIETVELTTVPSELHLSYRLA